METFFRCTRHLDFNYLREADTPNWKRNFMKKRKVELADLQAIARSRGGECLSTIYCGMNSKHRWGCDKGHEWEAIPASIDSGRWCPYCAGKLMWFPGKAEPDARLDNCRSLAAKQGGKCLSVEYVNSTTRLHWQCADGHEWETAPSNITSGKWCPTCAIKMNADIKRGNIDEYIALAAKRGGKCLSVEYVNNTTKLHWQCSDGHRWEATPHSIKTGQWCPQCSGSLGEEICRGILERLTDHAWPKARPDWLISPRGGRMEIDGYCELLGVGFEYHGIQHYKVKAHFHKGNESLGRRQADDLHKKQLCEKRGVKLIIVSYTMEGEALVSHLADALATAMGRQFPIPDGLTVDSLGFDRGRLQELQSMAKDHGGECLSKTFLGMMVKHSWRCASGHEWEALPHSIRMESWCPYCYGNRLWAPGMSHAVAGLDECRTVANQRGGSCLSTEYQGNHINLSWRCKDEHAWEATPSSVKGGSWCPYCTGRRYWATDRTHTQVALDECCAAARNKGGMCLSTEYLNNTTKLHWRCAKGHEWYAMPKSIRRGGWCPACSYKARGDSQRGSIDDCHAIAKANGGMCLSLEYVSRNSGLLWRCKDGHEWKSKPYSVKQGHWCPVCGGTRGRLTPFATNTNQLSIPPDPLQNASDYHQATASRLE